MRMTSKIRGARLLQASLVTTFVALNVIFRWDTLIAQVPGTTSSTKRLLRENPNTKSDDASQLPKSTLEQSKMPYNKDTDKYTELQLPHELTLDCNDTNVQEGVFSFMRYVRVTNCARMQEDYGKILDVHYPVAHRTSKYCTAHKYNVPSPETFFAIKTTLVNPYTFETLVQPKKQLCDDNTFLLVVVLSYHANVENRLAIRNTWGNLTQYGELQSHIKVVFLFGKTADAKLEKQIQTEHVTHGDVLQANFIEHYRNLTIKTRMAYKWIMKSCQSAKYVIKADDDVVLNVPKLYKTLRGRTDERTLIGHCNVREPIARDARLKFKSTCDEMPFEYFPIYMDGPTYVLTGDVISDLYMVSHYIKQFYIDDVYSSGFLTLPLNISMKCEKGFGINDKLDKPELPAHQRFVFAGRSTSERNKAWTAVQNVIK